MQFVDTHPDAPTFHPCGARVLCSYSVLSSWSTQVYSQAFPGQEKILPHPVSTNPSIHFPLLHPHVLFFNAHCWSVIQVPCCHWWTQVPADQTVCEISGTSFPLLFLVLPVCMWHPLFSGGSQNGGNVYLIPTMRSVHTSTCTNAQICLRSRRPKTAQDRPKTASNGRHRGPEAERARTF